MTSKFPRAHQFFSFFSFPFGIEYYTYFHIQSQDFNSYTLFINVAFAHFLKRMIT